MKKNVGDLDRYIRIAGGLFMLGYGTKRDSVLMMALGSLKVAEGITRYCPVLDKLGLSTRTETPQPQKGIRRVVSKMVEEF